MNLAIERIYDKRRRQAHAALEERTAALYEKIPALSELSERRQGIFRDAAARRIDGTEAGKRFADAAREEAALLFAHGLTEQDLKPQYTCPVCSDTGWIGAAERMPCVCRLLLQAELDPAIGINDRETFEQFSADIFPTEMQKKQTLNAKAWLERYADALPAPEKPNVLLLGMAGLGKSYLGNAIAYRALSRGIEARRVTAYALIEDALERIRTHAPINTAFLNAPLLVIDDLGSEALIPNVSEETLFSLLNERLIHRRATVIATNLSLDALRDRYGERIFSRLIERDTAQAIQLTGENLRNRRATC